MAACEAGNACYFIVPGDPDQVTGGYRYVKRLAQALADIGYEVHRLGLEGRFPMPDQQASESMNRALSELPDGSSVVLDGLAMGGMPEVLARHRERLHLIALVHHPLADETGLTPDLRDNLFRLEKQSLDLVDTVITTSPYTARRLADFDVDGSDIAVIEPGVDAPLECRRREYSAAGPFRILCVAHLSPRKAQTDLLEALSGLTDMPWSLTLAGSEFRDAAYGRQVRQQVQDLALSHRVWLPGEVTGEELSGLYAQADLFVLPSRYEGYGMVIDEAIATGLPVICSDGGALADTGRRPGILQYPAGDIERLRGSLAEWLGNPAALAQASDQARQTAATLRHWRDAAGELAELLTSGHQRNEDSCFDHEWLSLREPIDHKARNVSLTRELDQWLEFRYLHREGAQRGRPIRIADLGAGAGSNVGYLVNRLSVPQEWLLLDHDPSLLEVAEQRARNLEITVDTRCQQLTKSALSWSIPDSTDLVTASALIDLVSEDWLNALAGRVAELDAALLVTLSVNGQVLVEPAVESDELVLGAFRQHQRRNKGTGEALGPEAPEYLAGALRHLGYQVKTRPADWVLRRGEASLQRYLLAGWQAAATEQSPERGQDIENWYRRRLQEAESGRLNIGVGHTDLLALPERCVE